MRAIRTHTIRSPSAAHHSARQAPHPRPRQPHSNAAGMPAAWLPPLKRERPQARQGCLPRGCPSHATRYAASQARRQGWRQYLRPGPRTSPQAPPNHKTRHPAAQVCRSDNCGPLRHHRREMPERSGAHTRRATASPHRKITGNTRGRRPVTVGHCGLSKREPALHLAKPGEESPTSPSLQGESRSGFRSPLCDFDSGEAACSGTPQQPPPLAALGALRSVLAFQHSPRTRPAHTAPPPRSTRRRTYRQSHRSPPARQRRTAHSPGRAAPPELADSSTPTAAHTQAPHASPRTRAPNTTTLAAATVRYARSVPRRAHTHLTIDIA